MPRNLHNTLNQLKDIPCPTLLIGGENDNLHLSGWLKNSMRTLTNNQIHLSPNSEHSFHWKGLEDFNHRVANFINN